MNKTMRSRRRSPLTRSVTAQDLLDGCVVVSSSGNSSVLTINHPMTGHAAAAADNTAAPDASLIPYLSG
jgi:hypothetical protein